MKRILALSLCVCLFGLLLCGCSEEGPYVPTGDGLTWDDGPAPSADKEEKPVEQDLVLVYYPDKTLNPYRCTDYTNRTLFSLLYQGLFAVDRGYSVSPMLCKSYTVSEDMRTYTFYIEEAFFSDGIPLTIDDVYASFVAAMESDVYKGRFLHVDGVSLSADGGITFKLDTAYENFPLLLDIPIVKAAEVSADLPLGTGPYYYDLTTAGARLRRCTAWWCDADMLLTATSIPLTVAQSVTQVRDAFEFSNVGLVCADPNSDNYADYRCDYELWDSENGGFLYLGCNVDSAVFSNADVRKALTHAIDRDMLVEKYYRSFAHSATLPASPQSPFYSTQLAKRYGYDSEKFSQALSAAGKTGAPVKLLVNKADTLRLRVARAIGKMLTDAGLQVEMLELSGGDYQYILAIKGYDLYLGQTRLSPNMDLSAFFMKGGALRYGGMTDAAAYSMCLQAIANQGNYYNLHQTVMEDGRLCPILFQSYSIHATRGLLTGLTPSRDNVFYYSTGRTMTDAIQQ
ncbi:MAG: ABC transporter substrate-binding protein [Oscillospiraceae bacterium]|nr:ABC transporter substrate-binding protein [Oscillospiraceae bacterium]